MLIYMIHELDRPLVLVGPQGSGKTTIGGLLARRLELELVDTDEIFEKIYQEKIKDSLEKDPNFTRRLESLILENRVKYKPDRNEYVISTGGGIVRPTGAGISPNVLEELTQKCRELLQPAHVVYLQSHEDLEQMAQINFERINQDSVGSLQRISFGDGNNRCRGFEDMIKQRHPYYEAVANYVALGQRKRDEVSLTPQEITSNILEYLRKSN